MAPDLQLLAQQASNVTNVIDRNVGQESATSDLPDIHTEEPILSTHSPGTQALSDKINGTTLDKVGPTTIAGAVAPEEEIESFPDLIEDPLQDEHTSAWHQSQYSDTTYGASQLYPNESVAESEEPQIQAFAKLEFDDGEFYMNTYAVELGRDIQAAREAYERESDAREGSSSKSGKRNPSKGGSTKSDKPRRENGSGLQGSIASEGEGVIVDQHQSDGGKKTKRKKAKSWSSSSRPFSRKSSMQSSLPKFNYNALAMASLMDHSVGVNGFATEAVMPSPELIPLIPIHPPTMPEGASPGHKSISRKHAKIAFNFQEHLFQVEILGRNGGFVDEEWYPPGHVAALVNGSTIQIGGVTIRFVLPDVPLGETGAGMGIEMGDDPLTGGRLSFDMAESSEEESEEEDEQEDDTSEIKEEREEPVISRTRGKAKKTTEAPPPVLTKRKGPGRPPKNGIISKREEALLKKQAREEARAEAEGKPAPGKGKIGKDTKEVKQEESSVQPNGKRKYVKRKRAGGTEDPQAVRESTEHTDTVPPELTLPPKPAKEKKPPKPPRSPSPVFDESKMTPEQLAKPQSSYVVLIHEALTNAKTGLSLPQIYRAIERRYPYFKLRVQTQGWQSSVRHNLSQHAAFRKIERDGKGWVWGLVPEVSIEKEKKRRTTPPPVSQQHYYPPNPMMQHPFPYPGMPPSHGHMPPGPYGMHSAMQPGRMPYPPPPRPGFPPPLVNAQSESTYRSPYQSTPPPATAQTTPQLQPPAHTNGANGNYPTPISQPLPSQLPGNYYQSKVSGPSTSPSPHPPQHSASSVAPNNGKHQQDVNQAVSKFKTALIHNMADKTRGEILVTSAINRVLGIQAKSSLSKEEEDPDEQAIMTTFSSMLGTLSKQNMEANKQDTLGSPGGNASPGPGANAQTMEDPSTTAVAAANAAKIALTTGDTPKTSAPGNEDAIHSDQGTKRPLGASDRDEAGDANEREAKRIAS